MKMQFMVVGGFFKICPISLKVHEESLKNFRNVYGLPLFSDLIYRQLLTNKMLSSSNTMQICHP